jgi:hypothetical protein
MIGGATAPQPLMLRCCQQLASSGVHAQLPYSSCLTITCLALHLSLSGAPAKSPHAPRTPPKKGGRWAAAGGGGGTKKLAAATTVASGEALQLLGPGKETRLVDQGIGASGGEARREARAGDDTLTSRMCVCVGVRECVFVNVCRVGKWNDKLAAMTRFKRALGVKKVDLVQVQQKVCEELNVAQVGAIFKGVDRILKDYTLGKKIGEGAFSEVFLLRSKTSKAAFADKIISKLNEAYDHPSLEKEVQIMKQTVHPNVMRLFAVYDEPFKTHLVN